MSERTPSRIERHHDALRRTVPQFRVADVAAALAAGALLVDTRSEWQRSRHGELPGAIVIARNVLEWRLDPTSPWRIPEMDRPDRRVIVTCQEGYGSTLAAASLRAIGVDAYDLAGGVDAWLAAGRATTEGPADERR